MGMHDHCLSWTRDASSITRQDSYALSAKGGLPIAGMGYSTVTVHRYSDGTSTLCLNRPRVLNAVNSVMLDELVSSLRSLDKDEQVRAIVLCGEGKHFCAGLDFSTFSDISDSLADESACPGTARTRLFHTIQTMQVRVVRHERSTASKQRSLILFVRNQGAPPPA